MSSPFAVIEKLEATLKATLVAGQDESGLRYIHTTTGRLGLLDWINRIAKRIPCAKIMFDDERSTPDRIRMAVIVYTDQVAETAASVPTLSVCNTVYQQIMDDPTLGGTLIEPLTFVDFNMFAVDDKRCDETVISVETSMGFVDGNGVIQPSKRLYIRDYEEGASDYTKLKGWTQLGTGRIEHGYTDNSADPDEVGQTDGMPHARKELYVPFRDPVLVRAFLPIIDVASAGHALKRAVVDNIVNLWSSSIEARYKAVLFKWRRRPGLDLVFYWPKAGEAEASPEITAPDGCPVSFHSAYDATAGAYPMGYMTREIVS